MKEHSMKEHSVSKFVDNSRELFTSFMIAIEAKHNVGGFISDLLRVNGDFRDITLEYEKKVSYDQEGIDIHGAIDNLEEVQDKLNKLIDMQVSRSEEGLEGNVGQLDMSGDEGPYSGEWF